MKWAALLVVVACGGNAAAPHDAAVDASDGAPAMTVLGIAGPSGDFGAVGFDDANLPPPPVKHFVVTNSGTAAAHSLVIAVTGDWFQQTGTSCVTSLPAGASCGIDVEFAPHVPGASTGSLQVTAAGGASAMVALSAVGLVIDDIFSISPYPQDFGVIAVGTSSVAQTFTVNNWGPSTKGPLTLALTGADPTSFSIMNDGCSGIVLAAQATCTFDVHHVPVSAGLHVAIVTVAQTTGGYSLSFTVRGTGVAADDIITIAPSAHDYGSIGVTQTQTYMFTATNVGTSTKTPTATLIGASAADFAITSDGCSGVPLSSLATCTVMVQFSPATVGAKVATLQIDSGANIASAALNGMAVADGGGFITANPGSLDYATVTVGQTAMQSFTITNAGAAPTTPASAVLSGANAAEFAIGADGCAGTSLANGHSCTVTVLFTPTATGAKQAVVSVSASTTATVGLSGTGG